MKIPYKIISVQLILFILFGNIGQALASNNTIPFDELLYKNEAKLYFQSYPDEMRLSIASLDTLFDCLSQVTLFSREYFVTKDKLDTQEVNDLTKECSQDQILDNITNTFDSYGNTDISKANIVIKDFWEKFKTYPENLVISFCKDDFLRLDGYEKAMKPICDDNLIKKLRDDSKRLQKVAENIPACDKEYMFGDPANIFPDYYKSSSDIDELLSKPYLFCSSTDLYKNYGDILIFLREQTINILSGSNELSISDQQSREYQIEQSLAKNAQLMTQIKVIQKMKLAQFENNLERFRDNLYNFLVFIKNFSVIIKKFAYIFPNASTICN